MSGCFIAAEFYCVSALPSCTEKVTVRVCNCTDRHAFKVYNQLWFIGRNISVSTGSHLLQFCLKPATNYIRSHNWVTDLSSHVVIIYCTWNDYLTVSLTMIYCNATLGEKKGVKAKIVSMCKHPDWAYLDAQSTLFLTLQSSSALFSASTFFGVCCVFTIQSRQIASRKGKQTCLTVKL